MAKEGITRTISIPQPNIFGRIGSGFGEGLAEQLPKEIERTRLAQGLGELAQEQNLTPFQQFSRLAAIPGITPQMLQSGAELLRQQGIAQGFRNVAERQRNPLREATQRGNIPASPISPQVTQQPTPSGLVGAAGTQAALQNYIPKSREQLLTRAADLYDENRELYPNPESAFQGAVQEDQQNQAISNALQNQRKSQIGVEERLRNELNNLRKAANVQIPDNVYQQIENDVLDKVKQGVPETEAAKEGQKSLDAISRQYNEFNNIGNWTLPFKNPQATRRAIESIRQDFIKRNDQENFADSLVGRSGLSYPKAYWVAYNPRDNNELMSTIKSLPTLEPPARFIKLAQDKEHLEAAKKLAPLIKKTEASPLAIAEELRMKNYDPDQILDYWVRNKDKFDFSQRQGRELNKTRNWFPSLNDLWLFLGAGFDKNME